MGLVLVRANPPLHRSLLCLLSPSHSGPLLAPRANMCVPQVYSRGAKRSSQTSSRDRIARLEPAVANIDVAAPVGSVRGPSPNPSPRDGARSDEVRDEESDRGRDGRYGRHRDGSPAPHQSICGFFSTIPSSVPTTLGVDPPSSPHQSPRYSVRWLNQARARLQKMMVTPEELAALSPSAFSGMPSYDELCPATSPLPSRDEMVRKSQLLRRPGADPVALASFLSTGTLTARQAQPAEMRRTLRGWDSIEGYIKAAMAAVHAAIISHVDVASTVEGISVPLLDLRMQLSEEKPRGRGPRLAFPANTPIPGLGRITPAWLMRRRIVSCAETAGLARAWHAAPVASSGPGRQPRTPTPPGISDKMARWERICAPDRLASMMFALPGATTTHTFPPRFPSARCRARRISSGHLDRPRPVGPMDESLRAVDAAGREQHLRKSRWVLAADAGVQDP